MTTSLLSGTDLDHRRGERATLLQLSTAFCAPCRAARRVLDQVASSVPGVTHLDVDAEDNLALVRRLQVDATPTTIVLDAAGAEVVRAGGVPDRRRLLSALAQAVSE